MQNGPGIEPLACHGLSLADDSKGNVLGFSESHFSLSLLGGGSNNGAGKRIKQA